MASLKNMQQASFDFDRKIQVGYIPSVWDDDGHGMPAFRLFSISIIFGSTLNECPIKIRRSFVRIAVTRLRSIIVRNVGRKHTCIRRRFGD